MKNDHSKFIAFISEILENLNKLQIVSNEKEEYAEDEEAVLLHAQFLTELYENFYENYFNIIQCCETLYIKTIPEEYKLKNKIEIYFLLLTYFRRKNNWLYFTSLFEYINHKNKDIFDIPIMQPFRFNYILHSEKSLNNSSNTDSSALTYKAMSEIKNLYLTKKILIENGKYTTFSNVVYADSLMYKLNNIDFNQLNKKEKDYWYIYLKDALKCIEKILNMKSKVYPLYFYIHARLRFLQIKYKNQIEDLLSIREEIKKALELENNLNKKTIYLAFIVELDRFDIQNRVNDQENEVKKWEKRSLKILSAFAAFVTFAVGFITKISQSEINFGTQAGSFFILLGIALIIFFVLDIIILENNFKPNYCCEHERKRHIISCCARAIILLTLATISIVIGCLFGYGIFYNSFFS